MYGKEEIDKAVIEVWDNPATGRPYEVNITFPEFTCLCPRSGYPDFATIIVNYVPDKKIVELKSLKLYLNSFRDTAVSHEKAANVIFQELSEKLRPARLEVIGDFSPRGNVKTVVRVSSEMHASSEINASSEMHASSEMNKTIKRSAKK